MALVKLLLQSISQELSVGVFLKQKFLSLILTLKEIVQKSFRVKVAKDQNTIYDVFMDNATVEETIVQTYDDHIDVLPQRILITTI